MHALPSVRTASDNDSVYPCCGLTLTRSHAAAYNFYHDMEESGTQGCLRVDHRTKEDPPRTASDIALFADYLAPEIGDIPLGRKVVLYELSLKDLRESEETTLQVHVAAPEGASVIKPVHGKLEEIILETYADVGHIRAGWPDVCQEILGQLNALTNPSMEWPPGTDDSDLYRLKENEDDFIAFHLMHDPNHRGKVKVTISAVRRADSVLDPDVLRQVGKKIK
jgi:hypothetical protein